MDEEKADLSGLLARIRAALVSGGSGHDIRRVVIDAGTRRRLVKGGDAPKRKRGRPRIDRATPKTRATNFDEVAERLERRAAIAAEQAAKKRAKKKVTLPHLKTEKATVHHRWNGDKPENVEIRIDASIKRRLNRWKCMDGAHVEMFIRDWERANASIRSPSLEVAGQGKTPLPPLAEIRMAAQKRLSDLQIRLGKDMFTLVVAVLICGAGPAELHKLGGEQHTVATVEIRAAIDSLASFYTPGRMRKNRTWEAAAVVVAEWERKIANER